MADTLLFDPQIEALLREVAADPDSCLLRVPRPRLLTGLFERERPVSAHATGLSNAERHLLLVHRSELAKLLRDACVLRLYAHAAAPLRKIRHYTAHEIIRPIDPELWRKRAVDFRGLPPLAADCDGMELLDRCIATDGVEWASLTQLALASQRLCPTTHARVYVAEQSILDGHAEAGLRQLDEAVACWPSPRVLPSIWINQGAALSDLDRLDDARRAYARAARADEPPFTALTYWLIFSIRSACAEDLREAARLLDSTSCEDHPGIVEIVDCVVRQRSARAWDLSGPAQDLAARTMDRVGPASRRIIHATLT